jgi:transcriptional regulator with PAS, ATPase and Fis domain
MTSDQRATEDEIERFRCFHHSFAVLAVRTAPRHDGRLPSWCPRVRRLMRRVDRIALYGRDMVEILLPEATEKDAREIGRKIVERREGEPPLVCGIALCPGAAATAEELMERSHEAALRATDKDPLIVESETRRTIAGEGATPRPDGIVAESLSMRSVLATVDRLANAKIPVLLQGEMGTGKEVIANRIHTSGPRKSEPLICVNCGAIPESLVESTLFGHEGGRLHRRPPAAS